jgi:hypothetical protein
MAPSRLRFAFRLAQVCGTNIVAYLRLAPSVGALTSTRIHFALSRGFYL